MEQGRWMRLVWVVIMAISLGSCGGGGGGGSGGGFSVSFDKSVVSFDLQEGQYPGEQYITATAHGTPPASGLFVGAVVNGPGIQQPIANYMDETSGQAFAYIQPMSGLRPGTYTGTVQLLACADDACHQHFPGSPHTVNYTIHVHPLLKVAPATTSISVAEKQAGTPQTLVLTLPDNATGASASVNYGGGPGGWLQVQAGTHSLLLTPNAAALTPGTYVADIQVTAVGSDQSVIVPVTLTVTYDPLQHLRVDKTSIVAAGPEGQVLSPTTLLVGLPPGSGGVNAAVSYGAGASGWLQLQKSGAALTLTPSTVGLAPGNYSASVSLSDPYSGESLVVPVSLAVSYDALQHLRIDQASLAFAGVETQALAAKNLHFGLPPAASGLATSVSYGAGASGWLQVQASGNDLQLTASTTGLAPGTYTASVTLQATGTSESLVVPVNLAVSKGLVALASETVTIDMDSSGTGQFAVQALAGVTAGGWTAASNQPWLVLDTPSGAFGTDVQWHVDAAQFSALANNGDYSVTITVAGSGLSAVTRQLTILKRFKEIAQVDTLALLAGESGEVLLYGEGFASFTGFADHLRLGGGLQPTSVTVLSDRLARITLQNVPAGTYSVALVSVLGIATRESTLRVLEPQDYVYQTVPTAGTKGSFVWDPVSRSAFAVDLSVSRIHRFGWDGTGFVASTVATPQPYSLAMDRSFRSLVLATWGGELQKRDPVTLELASTVNLGAPLPSTVKDGFPLPISGDNRAWLPKGRNVMDTPDFFPWHDLQRVNVDSGAKEVFVADGAFDLYYGPWGRVSANGRRVMMSQTSSLSPAPSPFSSDLINNALTLLSGPSVPAFFYAASADRRGSVWLLGNFRLFDFGMNLQGEIWLPSGWGTPYASALSPDGTRAYMLAYANGAIDPYQQWQYDLRPRIYVYDTSPLSPTQSSFPLLGYIELPDYPGCRQDQWSGCSFKPVMTLAEDGHTVFLVGDRLFIVQPIPVEYRAATAAPAAPAATAMGVSRSGRQWSADMRYWRLRPQ